MLFKCHFTFMLLQILNIAGQVSWYFSFMVIQYIPRMKKLVIASAMTSYHVNTRKYRTWNTADNLHGWPYLTHPLHLPSKYETLVTCWFNVGPVSQMVGQHWTSTDSCLLRVSMNPNPVESRVISFPLAKWTRHISPSRKPCEIWTGIWIRFAYSV